MADCCVQASIPDPYSRRVLRQRARRDDVPHWLRCGWTLVAYLLLVLLAACRSSSVAALNSGIQGQVLIGPMCPVMRQDQPCPDQPFEATIKVLSANGRQHTVFRSDGHGRFQLALAPGTYTLAPETQGIAYAEQQTVEVLPDQFVSVTISYDSGIR